LKCCLNVADPVIESNEAGAYQILRLDACNSRAHKLWRTWGQVTCIKPWRDLPRLEAMFEGTPEPVCTRHGTDHVCQCGGARSSSAVDAVVAEGQWLQVLRKGYSAGSVDNPGQNPLQQQCWNDHATTAL
jgi:hypothetical protein